MKRKRERLNLSIDSEVLDFAKKWSYVNKKPISRFVEDLFREKMALVKDNDPESYLFDPKIFPSDQSIDEASDAFDEWLEDKKEADYCKKHPDSKRAKMRASLVDKRIKEQEKAIDEYSRFCEGFTQRWHEVF